MDIYHFDPKTGELAGVAQARESPLEPGVFLLPQLATFDVPPEPQEGHTRVWDGAQWIQKEDRRGKVYWRPDGTKHVLRALDEVEPDDALDEKPAQAFELVKSAAKREVDYCAGLARLRYITDIPGQQGVYLIKAQQAKAFRDAGYKGDVPAFIQAECDSTRRSAAAVADGILQLESAWVGFIGPAIEGARIGAKAAIEAAATEESVQAILQQALATLNAT